MSTTAGGPTEAVRRFDSMPGWHLVMATDRKSPSDYALEHGTVVTPQMQEAYDPVLSELIGWDCIQRRNFAFLFAVERGAELVAIVDDDVVPTPEWGQNVLVGRDVEVAYYDAGDAAAFDPVGATNEGHLWHRGFPLQLVAGRDYSRSSRRVVHVDVEESLWDGAGDFDAVCRMIYAPTCAFDPARFPISSNVVGPFSAINTFMSAKLLRDYFLFPHVGRLDDVWAGYYLQSLGHRVVYSAPTVVHERVPRDLTREMALEQDGYLRNLELVKDLAIDSSRIERYLPERALRAFERYRSHFA